jgi:hypothetical protein
MTRNRRAWRCQAALIVMLLATFARPGHSQTAGGGNPGEWLTQFETARTLGLGGAFVAAADDPLGALWNPAGLSLMDQNQLRFETARLFGESTLNSVSLAVPGSRLPSFGLSMVSLSSGEFERTNALNDPLGTFREGETAYLFTMAKNISPRFALGVNAKLAQQTIESASGGGLGFDVGALMNLTPDLRLGVSILNLGGPSITLRDVAEPWPSEIRGGLALTLLGGRALAVVEFDHSDGLGTRVRGGTEYRMLQGFTLRLGYDDEHGSGGLSYRFAPQYEFDYGVTDHALGMTHRAGVSYRFGGFFASSHADPSVFSPTGERAVTRISLNARTKGRPEDWSLEVLDKGDRSVRRFGGQGQPPSHIEWDGKDETGLPLADGVYRYRLQVRDGQGRTLMSATRALEISTSGPQGTVPLIPVQ